MIDVIPEWIPQNGHQRQETNGHYIPGMHTGFPQPRSLMEREDVSLLLLNSLAFGEDERVNELIQQAVLPDMICSELIEYPFLVPPDEKIWGPVNLGFCETTGAPVGIYPHEVHTLIAGGTNSGKTTPSGT